MINPRGLLAGYYYQLIRRPRNLVGASAARVLYGVWLATFYVQGFVLRDFLWGPSAPIAHDLFLEQLAGTRYFSLLAFAANPLLVDVLALVAVLSSLCVIVGLFTRAALITSATLLWSFHARNNYILDGGDNIGRIVLLFFVLMDSSRCFSVDSRFGRRVPRTPIRNLWHNVGLLAITLQLCALYLTSGFSKLIGPLWQNGTALYYVMRSAEFSRIPWAHQLATNIYIVTLSSYGIMALQCSFGFLVWNRRSRVVLIAGVVFMHLAIAYFLGLVRFSMVMVATLLLLIPDSLVQWIHQRIAHIQRGLGRHHRRFPGMGVSSASSVSPSRP